MVVVVVKKIFRHPMAVHHSALLHIAIAQACLKLENTVMIIALASAVQKPLESRKYCMLVASSCCRDSSKYFGFDCFGVGFDTRGGAGPHVSELLCYV